MNRNILPALLLLFLLINGSLVTSCGIRDKKTTLVVVENNRHYYPILRGQKLKVMFPIKNVGKYPFILTDVFTSCGCTVVSEESSIKAIPPGKVGNLILEYNSDPNIGYVKQYITLYGNMAPVNQITITFDVHVVPEADYTRDYEQIYKENEDLGGIKQLVDGKEGQKGYYLSKEQ